LNKHIAMFIGDRQSTQLEVSCYPRLQRCRHVPNRIVRGPAPRQSVASAFTLSTCVASFVGDDVKGSFHCQHSTASLSVSCNVTAWLAARRNCIPLLFPSSYLAIHVCICRVLYFPVPHFHSCHLVPHFPVLHFLVFCFRRSNFFHRFDWQTVRYTRSSANSKPVCSGTNLCWLQLGLVHHLAPLTV